MIDLVDMRCFVEVIESGGFGRAAQRLGMSKSMISRRISRMEAALGAPLVSRTTRGISATEVGLEFKARSERILADITEAQDAVAQQSAGVVGRLRLSAPISFGVKHVTPVLAELATRHPRLEIDVSYSDRIVDLIGERFDAAIRIGVLRDSTLVARRLAPFRAILVASPSYIEQRGRPLIPADLARHDCLIPASATASDWVFRKDKRTHSVHPKGRLRADNGEALVRWAIDSLGITLLPSFLVSDAIAQGRLEPLLVDYETFEGGIHVVRPPGASVPAKVRVLIDTLVERFGGAPTWDACLMHARPAQT
jgi:DNA-binding transcriptional LysR family regulator